MIDIFKSIRTENQAKLQPEDQLATTEMCFEEWDGFVCTKQLGHEGDHIAHSSFGSIIRRWQV